MQVRIIQIPIRQTRQLTKALQHQRGLFGWQTKVWQFYTFGINFTHESLLGTNYKHKVTIIALERHLVMNLNRGCRESWSPSTFHSPDLQTRHTQDPFCLWSRPFAKEREGR